MHTILIIDDDPTVLLTLKMALEKEGYGVSTAASGEEGLALARRHPPDLILTDLHMPGTDGHSVLEAVRADPALAGKQVVLMTGNPRHATPRVGMEWGADDFLVKPFGIDELSRCVAARMRRADVHWRVEDKVVKDLRANLHEVLPHEFFTPLAGVLGLVEILKTDIHHLNPHEVQEILSEIETCGLKLHRTLRNYLLIIDSKNRPNRPVADIPADVVQSTIENAVQTTVRRKGRSADLSLSVAPVGFLGIPSDVATITEELVDNACSFSSAGTPIIVRLEAPGVLTVQDRGRGLTETQIATVGSFHQFDRKKYEQQGLGVGLALVKQLAAHCRAELRLTSEPDRGTTAQVTFRPSIRSADSGAVSATQPSDERHA